MLDRSNCNTVIHAETTSLHKVGFGAELHYCYATAGQDSIFSAGHDIIGACRMGTRLAIALKTFCDLFMVGLFYV